MPAQSVWMIRISLGYLFVITLIGSLLLVHKVIDMHPAMWAFLPVHYEMAIWGWMVQFVMGAAYWMFPRYLQSKPRGSEWAAWMVVVLLNTGLWLLVIANLMQGVYTFKVAGRLVIAVSIILFIFLMWNRIVSYRDR